MTCQACGRDVFEDDLFCGRCGARLPGRGDEGDSSPAVIADPPGLHDADLSPTTYPIGEELIVGGGDDLRQKRTAGEREGAVGEPEERGWKTTKIAKKTPNNFTVGGVLFWIGAVGLAFGAVDIFFGLAMLCLMALGVVLWAGEHLIRAASRRHPFE
jgi:hypothetical protein